MLARVCVCSVLDWCLLLLWTIAFSQLHLANFSDSHCLSKCLTPESLIREMNLLLYYIDPSICPVKFVPLPKDSGTQRDMRQPQAGQKRDTRQDTAPWIWFCLVFVGEVSFCLLVFVCSLGVVGATPVTREHVGLPRLLLI